MPTIRLALPGPFLITCFLLSALLVGAPTTVLAVTIEKIAVQGDPVPGVPGATFKYFDSVLVNRHGQVAFGTIDSNDTPYYMTNTGGGPLRAVARPGTTAVGDAVWVAQPTRLIGIGPNAFDVAMRRAIPTDTGIIFAGEVQQPSNGITDDLWSVDQSGNTILFPGTSLGDGSSTDLALDPFASLMQYGTAVASPSGDRVVAAGKVAIWPTVEIGTPVGTDILRLDGTVLPEFLGGIHSGLSLNTLGTISLELASSLTQRGGSTQSSIWLKENEVWRQLAGPGLPVPGSDAVQISAFHPSINSRGEIAYITAWEEGAKTQQAVIKVDISGNHNLIAQFDEPRPEQTNVAPNSVVSPVMLEDGSVAFVVNSDNVPAPGRGALIGLWSEGNLDTFARQFTEAPGTDTDFLSAGTGELSPRFNLFLTIERLPGRLAANTHGDLLFNAITLDHLDVSVWARLGDTGQLIPLILPGQELDVNGVLKTVRNASAFTGNSNGVDGRPTSLSNTRQVAVTVLFTDLTEGLFLVTIPEPSTAALVLGALAGALSRRGRPHRSNPLPLA